MPSYDPRDWYWIVGADDPQVYASARAEFVPADDPAYLEWLASDNAPTPIGTLDNLKGVLTDAGVPPYLSVTPRQARLALLGAGLLNQVETAVTNAGGAAKITWDYATQIRRTDPLVTTLGATLGLSDAQIDALFEQAAAL